jgi:hypothetical protein
VGIAQATTILDRVPSKAGVLDVSVNGLIRPSTLLRRSNAGPTMLFSLVPGSVWVQKAQLTGRGHPQCTDNQGNHTDDAGDPHR